MITYIIINSQVIFNPFLAKRKFDIDIIVIIFENAHRKTTIFKNSICSIFSERKLKMFQMSMNSLHSLCREHNGILQGKLPLFLKFFHWQASNKEKKTLQDDRVSLSTHFMEVLPDLVEKVKMICFLSFGNLTLGYSFVAKQTRKLIINLIIRILVQSRCFKGEGITCYTSIL